MGLRSLCLEPDPELRRDAETEMLHRGRKVEAAGLLDFPEFKSLGVSAAFGQKPAVVQWERPVRRWTRWVARYLCAEWYEGRTPDRLVRLGTWALMSLKFNFSLTTARRLVGCTAMDMKAQGAPWSPECWAAGEKRVL